MYISCVILYYNFSGMKKHVCPNCPRSYTWKTGLWRHLKYNCGKEQLFYCTVVGCNFKATMKSKMDSHMIAKHGLNY